MGRRAHPNPPKELATMKFPYATILLSLLALSVTTEVLWMGNISRPPTTIYHMWHAALMLFVITVRLAYQKQLSPQVARYARILIAGMAMCALGDVVNSAISGIEPISQKLSIAIILFGAGYSLYVYVLYRFSQPRLALRHGIGYRMRWSVVMIVAVANTVGWVSYVRAPVAGHRFLELGSFLFNLVIYTLMISFSIWYFWANRLSLPALPVLIGGLLLPLSDLYLFSTWLAPGQDRNVPVFDLYAANWILYFGGQVLFAFLPACENDARLSESPRSGNRPAELG
ncbi:putative membrane protein [Mycobacterium kansasii 732]|nr:putative membrane protein [Mycobacterium kansasii 732]